jgi:hypothetical protein
MPPTHFLEEYPLENAQRRSMERGVAEKLVPRLAPARV